MSNKIPLFFVDQGLIPYEYPQPGGAALLARALLQSRDPTPCLLGVAKECNLAPQVNSTPHISAPSQHQTPTVGNSVPSTNRPIRAIRAGRRVCQTRPRWSGGWTRGLWPQPVPYTSDCSPSASMRFRSLLCWF